MEHTDHFVQTIDDLYDLYADELYRFARFTLRDEHLAEDVVQEVFIRAIRGWDSFRGDASRRTWLWQIARNYMRDVMRKNQVRNRHSVQSSAELHDVGAPFESLLELEDQLSELTVDQRQVFVLRCMQDLSVREVADILHFTESKVKTTLSRALARLRKQMTADEAETRGSAPADKAVEREQTTVDRAEAKEQVTQGRVATTGQRRGGEAHGVDRSKTTV